MNRFPRRAASLLLGAGGVLLAFVPIAAAATTTTLLPTAEGWYQPNPSCAAGCVTTGSLPAQPPTSPYPARTMQVGYSAGQETARSYLAFSLSGLTGVLSAALFSVPLDTAQADGSLNPETAKLQVCLASGAITSVDGSFDTPPATDCTSHAKVTYLATPTPHLQADLAPLVPGLPSASGLALLPDATAGQTDSWRVVFSAHDRTDPAKTPPATMTVTVADAPAVTTVAPPAVSLPNPTSPGLSGVTPVTGTGFAAAPPVLPPATAQQPLTAPVIAPALTPATNTQRTITVGYAYPVVWLLPLGFLVLFPLAARALTSDLGRVG